MYAAMTSMATSAVILLFITPLLSFSLINTYSYNNRRQIGGAYNLHMSRESNFFGSNLNRESNNNNDDNNFNEEDLRITRGFIPTGPSTPSDLAPVDSRNIQKIFDRLVSDSC